MSWFMRRRLRQKSRPCRLNCVRKQPVPHACAAYLPFMAPFVTALLVRHRVRPFINASRGLDEVFRMTHRTTYWCETPSPVVPLLLAGDATSLSLIHFQHGRRPLAPACDWVEKRAPCHAAVRQPEAYFSGQRRSFEHPLAPEAKQFQRSVCRLLRAIPYGATVSYGELARRAGNPRA